MAFPNTSKISDMDHAVAELDAAILIFESACENWGGYMPAIALRLRIHADEMADKYPDEANGGNSQ